MEDSIAALAAAYPWPEVKPDVAPNPHGWASEAQHRAFSRWIGPETRTVLEIGSWLGKSTGMLLKLAKNAVVIAIDTWEGSEEHRIDPGLAAFLPTLYETFLVNMWDARARIIPMRTLSYLGLVELKEREIRPDMVYIDGDHSFAGVRADLEMSLEFFPGVAIVGDDWGWNSVNAAARSTVPRYSRELGTDGAVWWVEP